jgi:hypothetical protein
MARKCGSLSTHRAIATTRPTSPQHDAGSEDGQRSEARCTLEGALGVRDRTRRIKKEPSQPPRGAALQETYFYPYVHYAIRWLMHLVALAADADPDRLSFTRTLRVARRSTASHPGFPPQVLDAAHRQTTSELLLKLLPPGAFVRTLASSIERRRTTQ